MSYSRKNKIKLGKLSKNTKKETHQCKKDAEIRHKMLIVTLSNYNWIVSNIIEWIHLKTKIKNNKVSKINISRSLV